MTHTERRKKLRAILSGSKCLVPATVFDPLSARIAESVGYEIGMLAGSTASHTILAAPDLILLTLTELADQIRRITRASTLSIIVDADHGYGNALNVMRAVQELEHAGVSALTIEDTVLPSVFGQTGGKKMDGLTSIAEGVGKVRAALAARSDPSLIIVGRTSALKTEGVKGAVARTKAYAEAGADAIFISGMEKLDQLEAIYAATKLPIIIGLAPQTREELEAHGGRILIEGQHTFAAVVKTLHETYKHLHSGGSVADLQSKVASPQEIERLVNAESYTKRAHEYLS